MREDVIQKLRRMIYDGTGVPAHLALITLDVAEAALAHRDAVFEESEKSWRKLLDALARLEESNA